MAGIHGWILSHVTSKAVPTGDGSELHFDCPFCSDTRKRFYIQIRGDKGLCCCHNCGWRGNFTRLVYKTQGCSYEQAAETAKDVQGGSYMEFHKNGDDDDEIDFADFVISKLFTGMYRPKKEPEAPKKEMPLPDNIFPVCGKCWSVYRPLQHDAISVLKSRCVTPSQAKTHNMQVCYDGKYKSRIIIPITNDGKTEFYVARSIYDWQKMKEYSPMKIEGGFKKSEVIFNLSNAAETGMLIINEGIYDALSWGKSGISLLGKIMSETQFQRIIALKDKVHSVYICLDADARQYAVKIARRLYPYFHDVRFVVIPVLDGKPQQWDANYYKRRFGFKGMQELINQAVPYTMENEIRLLMSA